MLVTPCCPAFAWSCAAVLRRAKKLTEYEKWEYKQLKMSGVLDVREYPNFDEEDGQGLLAGVDEVRGVTAVAGLIGWLLLKLLLLMLLCCNEGGG